MPQQRPRFRLMLMEDVGCTLVPFDRAMPDPDPITEVSQEELIISLLSHSMMRLERRGVGSSAWASSVKQEPLAFLLDSLSDAWLLRDLQGHVVFANRAAYELCLPDTDFLEYERFERKGKQYLRRGMIYSSAMLEIVRTLE